MQIPDETVDWFAEWRWGHAYYTKERSAKLLSDPTRRNIEHQSDQMRVRARETISELLTKAAPRPLLDQTALLDEIAVRNKIAEWYGAEWNSQDGKFYETDDTGTLDDEDEGAMHAYRGFKWAQELARPMPTREQIAEAMHDHQMETHGWRQDCDEEVCIAIFLDRAGAVLALLNGTES